MPSNMKQHTNAGEIDPDRLADDFWNGFGQGGTAPFGPSPETTPSHDGDLFSVQGGTAGPASSSGVGGTGGQLDLNGGTGGACSSAQAAGPGGPLIIEGGVGGAGSAARLSGRGGDLTITGGNAGNANSGSGNGGGNLVMHGGIPTGGGTAGQVQIGLTNTESTKIVGTGGKLGTFGVVPVIQPAGTGNTTGFLGGAGGTAKADSVWAGAAGSSAYTVGDIVTALKSLGLLAQ